MKKEEIAVVAFFLRPLYIFFSSDYFRLQS